MVGALSALKQLADIVEPKAGPQCTKVTGLDHERRASGNRWSLGEGCSKGFIHDLAKRPAAAASP